jgi:hypothetical protein
MTGEAEIENGTLAPSPKVSGGLVGRPPRWVFHVMLAVAALPLLWAHSAPRTLGAWEVFGWLLWIGFAVTWFVRLVLYVLARRRLSWWFLVAPLMLVVLVTVLDAHVPLKLRWAGSHDAFEAALARVKIGPRHLAGSGTWPCSANSSMDETIGSYRIVQWCEPDNVDGMLFVEKNRAGWKPEYEGGFAFLPNGPGEMRNRVWTTPLGDGWYAWSGAG